MGEIPNYRLDWMGEIPNYRLDWMGEIPNYRLDGRNPENYHHPTRVVDERFLLKRLSGRNSQ